MVRLLHAGTGREIARLERAETAFARMRGLLGRPGLPPGEGMIIERCSSIHTFFMRFPLDVLFLDARDTVQRVARGVPPWRLLFAPGARRVVELAAGALESFPLAPGDAVKLEELP